MVEMRRLRAVRAPLLIGLILAVAIGVIGYVQFAVKRLEDGLPLRVMAEKRDMERVARNYYELLAVTQAAKVHPTEGNVGAIIDHLDAVDSDLKELRTRYTFDTLIGASALHATISPTVDDARIWLTEGFGRLDPTSPILLDLVLTRIRDTMNKVYDKTTEADRIAFEILEVQSTDLGRLRSRLVLVLVAIVVLAVSIVWLAVRQQRISRQRTLAEAAERRAEARLQDALESTSEGFAFFDAEERLVISNSRYRDYFLRAIRDKVSPGTLIETILRAVIETGMVKDAAENAEAWLDWRLKRFRKPSGSFSLAYTDGRWVQINERKTGDGGTVVIYSDVTDLKVREFELMRARDQAEAASEAKSSFLANVSHELRTPLTSILGFARIVQKRFVSTILPQIDGSDREIDRAVAQIQGNLEIMLTEGERLTKLINDVLDLEKIEAGEMVWNIAPVNIEEVIGQAAAATESLYLEKGLDFVSRIAPDMPPVQADRDRLVQVLVNLISNAVKFSERGTITCRARKDGVGRVKIEIEDQGSGIAPEDHATIFEKFRQVGDTLTEKPSGTGLGLPICREIVEHLGGKISIESRVGEGSRFRFWLPAAPAEAEV